MTTGARVANGLLLAAGLAFLLGSAAFVLGATASGWSDLARGVRWYGALQGRSAPVLTAAIGAVAIGGALFVAAARGRRRWRRALAAGRGSLPGRRGVDAKRLRSARQHLDRELCRLAPRVEAVVDALLGELVDLEASALRLEPTEMAAQISFEIRGQLHPLTTMPEALYARVLAQLQLLVDVSGEGEGRLDFRSSTRVDELGVVLDRVEGGPTALVRPLRRLDPTGVPGSPTFRPSRRQRNISTLLRLEPPTLASPLSAGAATVLTLVGEDDPTDSHSGLLGGRDPSAEAEVAPLVPPRQARPLGRLEVTARLSAATLLLASVTSFFAPAYLWGARRLARGESNAPWREVVLEITSEPVGGLVTIAGRRRGVTPLHTSVQCRNLPTSVVVEAAGHIAWQWDGICPGSGALVLRAALQHRRW